MNGRPHIINPTAAAQQEAAVQGFIASTSQALYGPILLDLASSRKALDPSSKQFIETCRDAAQLARAAAPFLAEAHGLIRLHLPETSHDDRP